MKKILRKQNSTYALSLMLFLLGVTALSVTLWKTWSKVSSAQNPFSAFWTLLWSEQLDFIPSIEFKLAYVIILGAVLLVSGIVIWALSRQWFYLPGETMWLQCPFCKRQWRTKGDKALVHCPYCRQLVHPKLIEKLK